MLEGRGIQNKGEEEGAGVRPVLGSAVVGVQDTPGESSTELAQTKKRAEEEVVKLLGAIFGS